MIQLATAIQHHPSRAYLLPRILAEIPDAHVVTDPGGPRNTWRPYRACLDHLPDSASHLLIVQDDAIPCPGFARTAHAALTARPDDAVTFFLGAAPHRSARAHRDAADQCRHWSLLDPADWVPAVALCFPAHHVHSLRDWADGQTIAPHRTSDDAILGDWMRATGASVWATIPSLIQHDDHVRSVMGNAHTAGRNPARVAACWIGQRDPTLIDWTAG